MSVVHERPAHPPVPRAADPVPDALGALAAGRPIVLDGRGGRDGVSDVVVAARHADDVAVNALCTDARGLVCLVLPAACCARLGLTPMREDAAADALPFTVSIEARTGVTTGISAGDRATTIRAATRAGATAVDVVTPGHVLPLRAADDGVLDRLGRPEAALDLVRLAGAGDAAVTCALLDDDGAVASGGAVDRWARARGVPVVSAAAVLRHRRTHGPRTFAAPALVDHGAFRVLRPQPPGGATAFVLGTLHPSVAVHVAHDGAALTRALADVGRAGSGVVVDAAHVGDGGEVEALLRSLDVGG